VREAWASAALSLASHNLILFLAPMFLIQSHFPLISSSFILVTRFPLRVHTSLNSLLLLLSFSSFFGMAVSHQSGVIENHWNDPPATTFSKPPTPSTTPGLPTPPQTPGIEGTDVVAGLERLLSLPSHLTGRNCELIFGRVRGLIKALEEGKIPGPNSSGASFFAFGAFGLVLG
jgi:hypothetical protein